MPTNTVWIKVYSNWWPLYHIKDIGNNVTTSSVANSVKKIIEDLEKKGSKDILKAIHTFIREIEKRSYDIDSIEIDSKEYYMLNNYSKLK